MRYVIELGERRKIDKDNYEWISHGYYNLYQPNGGPMIVVQDIDEAFHFPKKENAEWVIDGNRTVLATARIVEHA